MYIYIYPRVHTFLPACSRVQIGIEKSRSQLKLEAQRIRRDKIPIISCPRRRPPPFPRSLLSLPGRRRGGGGGGGGGERRGERGGSFPCKNSIPLGIEVSKTRMGIYITHSHLAYLPNKGFSLPPPLTPQASSTPAAPPQYKACPWGVCETIPWDDNAYPTYECFLGNLSIARPILFSLLFVRFSLLFLAGFHSCPSMKIRCPRINDRS